MKTAVQKWGNSLGLRIPAAIACDMQLRHGTPVIMQFGNGILTIRLARAAQRKRSKRKLKNLLDRITPDNVQPTYKW